MDHAQYTERILDIPRARVRRDTPNLDGYFDYFRDLLLLPDSRFNIPFHSFNHIFILISDLTPYFMFKQICSFLANTSFDFKARAAAEPTRIYY